MTSLRHLRSDTANKRPDPAALSTGQVAINYESGSPGLFFKDSAGNLVKAGPVHIGTSAPNATPAAGGSTGNAVGEFWLDTTGGAYNLKVWDGTAWRSAAGEYVNVTGDTMTGDLTLDNANIVFEGSTADTFETTLTVADPTADNTITLPNVSGTVVTTGDTGSVTSAMIADATIVNADISASAEIAVSKLADGTARQLLQTDAAGTGVEWTSNVDVPGTLDVTGATTLDSTLTVPLGSAASPTLRFSGDGNTGVYSPGADQVALSTGGTGRLFIDASGNVGVGAASAGSKLDVSGVIATNDALYIYNATKDGQGIWYNPGAAGVSQLTARIAGDDRMTITSSGLVGIGTSSPDDTLHLVGSTGYGLKNTDGTHTVVLRTVSGGGILKTASNHALVFGTNDTERARIDSSGRLLVGTSTHSGEACNVEIADSTGGVVNLRRADSSIVGANNLGIINFIGDDPSAGKVGATISAVGEGTWATDDYPTRLVFSTTANGASSPTERMRITSDGDVLISKDTTSFSTDGIVLADAGYIAATRTSATPLSVIRNGTDGTLVNFEAQNVQEGTISVSGTTVSYNGAHLSRWSQLPSGAERTKILRGTVLSNIDEMCEWGEEENEQLNRMKVSDVEGDKNVSGVFQAWDDDDDTYTNDFYCAMTGDFIIRIAQGVTVERGDLLMSAGDGTAKPQDDDIIRSKTIAKVTSTNVSCTYDDGSYCVPCVLMAC